MIRFLHIADIHLGFQQYNSSERFNDFGVAFKKAISYAVEQNVDAILIAGDLFHKSAVEPIAFIQATEGLVLAQEAKIPVIAVEGNHDKPHYRQRISWLEVLSYQDYLKLLVPELEDSGAALEAWDGETGAYIDMGHLRIIGVPWLGAAATFWIPKIASAIKALPQAGIHCTILLTHAGIEGEMPNIPGCLTHEQLVPLKDSVDYIGLGHLHKPFERDGWLFNPGSLESCSMDERQWARGMYDVTVEADGSFAVKHIKASPRPFYRKSFSVNSYSQPATLYHDIREMLRENAERWTKEERKPVIEINLAGTLEFDRTDLDLERIRQAIIEEVDPLVARVNAKKLTLRGMEISAEDMISSAELEHTVLREIALSDKRYATHPDTWANIMLDTKEQALKGANPESIVAALERQMEAINNHAPPSP